VQRPKVKPEHVPYQTSRGTIRIGSVIYGSGAEIDNPPGWVWPLLQSADGTRSPDEIIACVRAEVPTAAAAQVRTALEELRAQGFLEDAAAGPGDAFTQPEQERYGRGVALLRWMDRSGAASAWELQERLRASRVLVVGLGGTGTAAVHALAASGVGYLHTVDPDTVEYSNLNRQMYRERDCGRAKTEATRELLRERNSQMTVTSERTLITSPEDLHELVRGPSGPFDVLLMCADQPPEIRRWANQVCYTARLPWIDGGYSGPLATAGVHVPGLGACWECHRAGECERRDLALPEGADESIASPRMPWNPANAITAGTSGLLVAHAALALLTGAPPLTPGYRYGLNLMAPDDEVYARFPSRPGCPHCGHRSAEVDRTSSAT
jgi:molybdopterin/thiamine biosynthesis adenylyltransferase